jgi:hypothetical protein
MRPHTNRSLSAHLREEDHSRLPFHPACPVCRRDRLSGSLDGEELVSRRTQAALAAGLLAFSTLCVPAAIAQEPDEISEGTAEVVVDGDPSSSVDFDPGGEAVQLPDEAPEAAAPPAADDDAGPLEQEPVTDVREPVVEANGNVTEPTAVSPAAPEPEAVAAPPTEAPAAATPPDESEPQEPQAETGPKAVDVDRREAHADKAGKATPRPKSRTAPPVADPIPAAEPAPATTATVEVAAPPATVHLVARSSGSRAAPGDRVHVVRPGESLWSIATDLLGEDATVARVAREVNRLWDLNTERIRTGDPDLLFAGTRLMLR